MSQEVFARLLEAGSKAPPADRLTFWCIAVARNVLSELHRKLARRDWRDLGEAGPDTEALAIFRLRCEEAKRALEQLPGSQRTALRAETGRGEPLTDSTKAKRRRAWQRMRSEARKSVGGVVALPRPRWILGPAGVAVAIPMCVGLLGVTPRTPHAELPHPRPQSVSEPGRSQDLGSNWHHDAETTPAADARPAEIVPPAPRQYHRRVSVEVPGFGPAGVDHYKPAPDEGPQPLACLHNLEVSEDICVSHPLRPGS